MRFLERYLLCKRLNFTLIIESYSMENANGTQIQNAFFRQLLFLAILVAIGLVIFKQLDFFIGAFLGAVTIYIVCRNILFKLTEKKKWKSWLASLLLVLIITVFLAGIGFLVFEVIASEIPNVDTSQIIVKFNNFLSKINVYFGFRMVPIDLLDRSKGFIPNLASVIFNTTYSFAANIFMMLVILYFMFSAGRRMERKVIEYIPFKGESLSMLAHELKNMIFSNAVGIPLFVLSQSVMALLIYWLLGINNALFWAFLTGICGLIPIIGAAIVWAPLSVYLMVEGNIWMGFILILYGAIIISNVDNVCRILLMKKYANTHALIVILGVILGIPLFGFWGIIFGPLLISSFVLLIRIYYHEYKLIDPKELDKNK